MAIKLDFWATTAQVLPVLMLAYVLERRFLDDPDDPERDLPEVGPIFVALAVSVAVASEFAALAGLLGHGGVWSARLVITTIGALLTLLVSPGLLQYLNDNLPSEDARANHPQRSRWIGGSAYLTTLAACAFPIAISLVVAFTVQ